MRGLRQAVLAGRDLPRAPRLLACATSACSPLLDAIVDLLPSPGRPRGGRRAPTPRTKARSRRAAGAGRALLRLRVQDHRRPPRRPHQPLPRLLRHAQVRQHRPQLHPRRRRARGRAWSCCRARPRRRCPRSRPATWARWPSSRRRTPATRCATRRIPSSIPPLVFPEPRHHLRHRAQDPRRRGQDLHRPAPHHGGGPGPAALPRRADPRDAALGHGPAPHRGGGGQAAQALQGRGQPQEAEDPLPGDDQGRGRGPRPAQEADRRPRAVRRLQDPHEAAAARRRTSSSWTTSSAAPSPRTSSPRWRRASRRRASRVTWPAIPMVDFQVELYDGAVPRRRLLRDVVQDRRLAGLQGRGGQVPAHPAGAGDEGRDRGARGATRAR